MNMGNLQKLALTAQEALQNAMSIASDAQAPQAEPIHLLKALLTSGENNLSAIIKRIGADSGSILNNVNAEIERAKAAEAQALADAKAHTDEKDAAMDARVQTVEGKAHEHANADELAKIADGDKAKWDAMEQNAKDYADGLEEAMDGRVGAMEAKVTKWDAAEQNAKDYA